MVRPLRLWRGDKGWNQKDLAREARVSPGTIARVESPDPEHPYLPYPSTRLKIATALGCRPSDISEFVDGDRPRE